jgi:glycosyltransferase involved in cell wall biosynthesis
MTRGRRSILRIAIVSETWLPQINGVSRTLDRLARYLAAEGDRLLVMMPRYPQPPQLPETAEAETFPSVGLPGYPEVRLPLAAPSRLRRRLAAFAPDVVHIATEGPLGLAALRAARQLQLPVVSSYHTNFARYLASYRLGALEAVAWRYLRWFHNRTALTLCPTPSIRRLLMERGFANVETWSRGVDGGRFRPGLRDPQLRRDLGFDSGDVVLLYVGRLAPEKNLAMLFAAFRQLQGPKRLLLVGDGPLRRELERTAPAGVIFAGYRQGEDLARHYASADIFAFPSLSETFGNVLLEAMAAGLPVVGFPVPGPADLVRPGATGLLASAVDAPSLATALQPLLEDSDLRRRLGQAARSYAESQDWDAVNAGVRTHYRRVGSAAGPIAGPAVDEAPG